jgi:hypothetical protein
MLSARLAGRGEYRESRKGNIGEVGSSDGDDVERKQDQSMDDEGQGEHRGSDEGLRRHTRSGQKQYDSVTFRIQGSKVYIVEIRKIKGKGTGENLKAVHAMTSQ